jgi:hypothetical protein
LAGLFSAGFLPLFGVVAYLGSLAYAVHFWIVFRPFRERLLTLLACMYLPFAWVVSHDTLPRSFEVLWLAGGLPALLPTGLISSLMHRHPEQMGGLGAVLTSLELVGGLWIIRLGRRRAIAYHLFALDLSTFASFVLNALLRM